MNKKTSRLVVMWLLVSWLNFLVAHAEEIGYDASLKRDPFVPLVGSAKISTVEDIAIEEVFLEGIGLDEFGKPFAVVNGEPYQKGESLGGWLVETIRPNGVLVSKDEETYFLDFEAERPKQDQFGSFGADKPAKAAGPSLPKEYQALQSK